MIKTDFMVLSINIYNDSLKLIQTFSEKITFQGMPINCVEIELLPQFE